jgi:hypothetical protein
LTNSWFMQSCVPLITSEKESKHSNLGSKSSFPPTWLYRLNLLEILL